MSDEKLKIEQKKQKESYRQARPNAKTYKLWLHFRSFIGVQDQLMRKNIRRHINKKRKQDTQSKLSNLSLLKFYQAKEATLPIYIFFSDVSKFKISIQKFKKI